MVERKKLVAMVLAVQNGDDNAITELYETFQSDIYYFIFKTVNNDRELAEDLTQDTFMEILETIHKLEEPAAFVTWSKQIAYHKCTAYFRKRKDLLVDENEDGYSVFDTIEEDREEFIPDAALNYEDLKKTIMAMIKELPEEQRSAIILRYFNEISVKEIAEIQGVTEGTVKSRLNYGRKAIKQSVEAYEKKNDVKLHCAGVLPLLLWFFKQYRIANGISLSSNTATTIFAVGEKAISASTVAATGSAAAATSGSTAASATSTSASTTAAATASASTTATATATAVASTGAKALATKVVAGILAATVSIGGVVAGFTKDECDHKWETQSIYDGDILLSEWKYCLYCDEYEYVYDYEIENCDHEWETYYYATKDTVLERTQCKFGYCGMIKEEKEYPNTCNHEWEYYDDVRESIIEESGHCNKCNAYEVFKTYENTCEHEFVENYEEGRMICVHCSADGGGIIREKCSHEWKEENEYDGDVLIFRKAVCSKCDMNWLLYSSCVEHEWIDDKIYEDGILMYHARVCEPCGTKKVIYDAEDVCEHNWKVIKRLYDGIVFEENYCDICGNFENIIGYVEEINEDSCNHEIDQSKEYFCNEVGEIGWCKHCGWLIENRNQ